MVIQGLYSMLHVFETLKIWNPQWKNNLFLVLPRISYEAGTAQPRSFTCMRAVTPTFREPIDTPFMCIYVDFLWTRGCPLAWISLPRGQSSNPLVSTDAWPSMRYTFDCSVHKVLSMIDRRDRCGSTCDASLSVSDMYTRSGNVNVWLVFIINIYINVATDMWWKYCLCH